MSIIVTAAATVDPQLSAWLDSPAADDGLTMASRRQFAGSLSHEDAYKVFADAILSPSLSLDEHQRVQRSYRAMQVLTQDLGAAPDSSVLMNATRAGLLAKDIFAALHNTTTTTTATAYVLHARKLLDALLDSYPSSVISAAGSGGKEGMEAHLRPLLLAETSSQTLSTLTNLVIHGCTGRTGQPSAEKTLQAAHYQQQVLRGKPSLISHGHRRKFVRNLSEWDFLSRIVECINDDYASVGEDLCETVLTFVECLGSPERNDPTMTGGAKQLVTESVGEEMVLAPLGRTEWWDPLFDKLQTSNATTKVTVTRAMMGIFTLATGTSTRIRRIDAPMTDATENYHEGSGGKEVKPVNETHEHKNKLLEWGLTAKIHQALIAHIRQICHIITMKDGDEEGTTTYWNRGDDKENIPGVPHPGRCRIVPFSSWRLHMIALLAEIVTYNGDELKPDPAALESFRHAVMTRIMDLPLPATLLPSTISIDDNSISSSVNPWPSLCDWVFDYPENNLYHYQFIRLFRAMVIEHHEPTLRLVLQKAKFVSRGVRACTMGGPIRGVLLECLNMLRLRSQSLPPSAFLRQFLYSHDGWKAFQEPLIEMTMVQCFGGKPIPGQEIMSVENSGIDLGSKYASDLGLDGMDAFIDEMVVVSSLSSPLTTVVTTTAVAAVSGCKKKKKKRKKKGKPNDSNNDGGDDDDEDDVGGGPEEIH